jgi:hypothetical protein
MRFSCVGGLAFFGMLVGCGSAVPGAPSIGPSADGATGSGGSSGVAKNPCAFTISGDVADRVELNSHMRLLKKGFSSPNPSLDVDCLMDPRGSAQSGNFPGFELSPFAGSGEYRIDGMTYGSGSVTVGARAGGPVFRLVGGDGAAGECTFTVMSPQAPKVGDVVEVSFSCKGLTTEFIGKKYAADVSDGVLGAELEFVE